MGLALAKQKLIAKLILQHKKAEICDYACMFKEYCNDTFDDEKKRNEILKGYCDRCPLNS